MVATLAEINRYKIEPYVVAGDVYSVAPHIGRGGWSWYTGSAGWLYRLITETLLGIRLEEGKNLRLTPILLDTWDGFSVEYYFGSTLYKIAVKHKKDGEASSLQLDNVMLEGNTISLVEDGIAHQVILSI